MLFFVEKSVFEYPLALGRRTDHVELMRCQLGISTKTPRRVPPPHVSVQPRVELAITASFLHGNSSNFYNLNGVIGIIF